eukprot:35751_1
MASSILSTIRHKFMGLSNWQKYGSILLGVTGILTMRKIYDVMYRKYYNYPNGPCGLPIIGSLLQVFNYEYISSLTNCYGSVFMIYAGLTPMIFINDLQIANKYLNKKEFSNKNIVMTKGYNDFLEMKFNKHYIFRRQLLHKSFITVLNSDYLNQIGINILQKHIFQKLNEKSTTKQHYIEKDLIKDLQHSVFSLFFITIFGKYKIPKDEDYAEFMPILTKFFNKFMEFMLVKLILGSSNITQFVFSQTISKPQDYYGQKLLNLCAKWLNEFEQNYIYEINNNKSINKCNENEASVIEWYKQYKCGKLSRKEMIGDIRVIMMAGIHSTSSLTAAMIVWLCVFPDIEQNIYNELKDFEMKYGIFQLKHVEELHILRAFVHEVFRFPSKGSFGNLPRAILTENVKINGFNIPKNTQIMVGFDRFGHDKSYWKNPYKFDISNFLDAENRFKNNVAFTKFGIGRRNCPGMSLAKKEIYLLLGRMILNYRFYTKKEILDEINVCDWDKKRVRYDKTVFKKVKIFVEKRND